MKPTLAGIAVAVAALTPSPASADCNCGGELLATTLVEGKPEIVYATSCGPPKPAQLALVDAGGKRVPLKVVASHRGHDRSTQIVLEPESPLAAGDFTLVTSTTYDSARYLLKVVAAGKVAPPAWASEPAVVAQSQVEFGCGPAKRVAIEVGSTHAALAFVELEDATSKQTGYVRVDKSAIGLGHGMCGGPFSLARGRSYTATITLIAPDHGTASTTKKLTFTYAPK